MRGYLQETIIEIGRRRGFVVVEDVERFYSKEDIEREMNKLIKLGYFEEENDGIKVIWRYKTQK